MTGQVNGFEDMKAILANERKVGGVIEVKELRLCSGEKYKNTAITNVEMIGGALCSISFVTDDGQHMIVNAKEISMIHEPVHKKVCELQNEAFKYMKLNEKLKYLQRLFEVNDGTLNPIFVEEATLLINDIGLRHAKQVVDINRIYSEENVYTIA